MTCPTSIMVNENETQGEKKRTVNERDWWGREEEEKKKEMWYLDTVESNVRRTREGSGQERKGITRQESHDKPPYKSIKLPPCCGCCCPPHGLLGC